MLLCTGFRHKRHRSGTSDYPQALGEDGGGDLLVLGHLREQLVVGGLVEQHSVVHLLLLLTLAPLLQNQHELLTVRNQKTVLPANPKIRAVWRERVTFFFCLPPPDLAGFDDGGGALSFFGACKEIDEEVSATSTSCVQWRVGKRMGAPSRQGRRRVDGDGGARERSEGEESAAPALARVLRTEVGWFYIVSLVPVRPSDQQRRRRKHWRKKWGPRNGPIKVRYLFI